MTVNGVPLTDDMRHERLEQLRARAAAMKRPRDRHAENTKIDAMVTRLGLEARMRDNTDEIKSHIDAKVDPLLSRAEGRIPSKRDDQTNAERARELQQAVSSVPMWRAELKQCSKAAAEEQRGEKRAAAEEKRAAKRTRQ